MATKAVSRRQSGSQSEATLTPTSQPSLVYHLRVGDFIVTALNDSFIEFPPEAVTGISHSDVAALNQAVKQPRAHVTVNAFLITTGKSRILVDTGCGADTAPSPGQLPIALRSVGVEPADISTVLLTHLHSDHLGGVASPDGKPAFPNAEIVLHEKELSFWFNDPPASASEPILGHFQVAERARSLRDRMRIVTTGEVLPGIRIIPEPGHTPGHSGYMIDSNNEQLLIWGDIIHQQQIQFARPESGVIWDVDHDATVQTRKATFEWAVEANLCVAGMHLDFHPFGYVVKEAGRFSFVKRVWSPIP